jgi:hypothetical protein
LTDKTSKTWMAAGETDDPNALIESFEAAADITKGYPVYLSADDKVSPSPGGDDAIGIATKTVATGKIARALETSTVRLTPEKNSNPRIFHITAKLMGMLQSLQRNYGKYIFAKPSMPLDYFRDNYCQQRLRISTKVKNPRLMRIQFKTLRTWKGTMEYHRTKDALHVMQILGHKNIKNTLIYIQLDDALFKEQIDYVSKVAKTEKDALDLIEAGFDFICDFEGHKLFRKRKY